jgi:hypothetical protein
MRAKRLVQILAAGAVCLLAASASAGVVLSDNTSQVPAAGFDPVNDTTSWAAISFGTAAQPGVLESATIDLWNNATTATLSLYTDNSGQLRAFVGRLVSPASYPPGENLVQFGGNNLPLAANSTYWLVLSGPSGTLTATDFGVTTPTLALPYWGYSGTDTGTGIGWQDRWGWIDPTWGPPSWETGTQPYIAQVVEAVPEVNTCLAGLAACLLVLRVPFRRNK